jgi:hypothetical protein
LWTWLHIPLRDKQGILSNDPTIGKVEQGGIGRTQRMRSILQRRSPSHPFPFKIQMLLLFRFFHVLTGDSPGIPHSLTFFPFLFWLCFLCHIPVWPFSALLRLYFCALNTPPILILVFPLPSWEQPSLGCRVQVWVSCYHPVLPFYKPSLCLFCVT